jgi:putative tricarboxylic transport membrane protein
MRVPPAETDPARSPAPASAPRPGGRAPGAGSDRWIALGLLAFAGLYALRARTFEAGFLVDPVGPRAFPLLLAGVMALAALLLGVRPTGERPAWPSRPAWLRAGILCVSLVAYGYLLEPLGYLVATTAVMVVLGALFGGPPARNALAALCVVVLLYFLFSSLLGLYLPAFPFS